jgi:hypothetical protein
VDLGEDSGSRVGPSGTSHESIRNAVDAIPTTVASATTNGRLQPLDDGRAVWRYAVWEPVDDAANAGARPDNAARANRRQRHNDYDTSTASRTTGGQKPNKLRVKEGRDIDAACPTKNAWDDAMRSLVPRLLDMSIIEWEAQRTATVEKLRDALDADFEYVPVTLSQRGFRNAIKRFMKTERSRLKARYMAGDRTCPVHIDPVQWERPQDYWGSTLQREKAERMTVARKLVKNSGNVGRKGKDGKEADLVSLCQCHPF